MVARRTLTFHSLDAAVADAERLYAVGYEKTGKWDLAQVTGHLANWLGYAMDGYPRGPLPIRMLMWIARNTVGPRLFRKYLAEGRLPDARPTMPQSVPNPSGDDQAAVTNYKRTVERATGLSGNPIPSPFFGRLTKEEWVQLNCVHAAHHLSFLV
ncbi:MAG TPA: DUF1569 domain-containing protein, partial [Fimbriiglobus sp.]